jgi:hypothetical protein
MMRAQKHLRTALLCLFAGGGGIAAAENKPAGIQLPTSPILLSAETEERLKKLEEAVKLLQVPPPAIRPAEQGGSAAPPPAPTAPAEPFAFADFSWLNGNSRQTESILDGKYFTGSFMVDTNYTYSFQTPADHSLVGSTTSGRHAEIQLSHLGIGGDFHWADVRGRLMTQFGLYSTMTVRNDPSPARGQWDLANAYRYISEGYGGYHFNVLNGINLDVGIFMSYVGLCSYYDFENWVYQESYVSANTPWFFNGLRLQIFPTDRLKVELWLINGWQSYGMYNEMPGWGWQILWRPTGWFSFVTNEYFGRDTLANADRWRIHTDSSVQVKYYDQPGSFLHRAAFSLTFDWGCETGGGVSCWGGTPSSPTQSFLGFMFYNRLWFWKDRLGLTIGGGAITNPGRYLVLVPPINGASAYSGSVYFSQSPGDPFWAWDGTVTVDYMPNPFITFRWELVHREASVPYFSGPGGITPPGGNQGNPGSKVDGWSPDLQRTENRMQFVLMVRL